MVNTLVEVILLVEKATTNTFCLLLEEARLNKMSKAREQKTIESQYRYHLITSKRHIHSGMVNVIMMFTLFHLALNQVVTVEIICF